jgi:hypothetical protein
MALQDIVTKGSADRSVTVKIVDSADGTPETGVAFNTAGIDLWYRREGAAVTSITEVTLAALTTAHADGGFIAIGNGDYRLDLPDAAFAAGAQYVDFGGTVTGMVVVGGRVRLVDFDLEAALATAAALATVDANIDAILVDTGTTIPATIATVDTVVDSILVDTAEIGVAGAGLTSLASQSAVDGLNDITAAAVVDAFQTRGATAQAGAAGTITLDASASAANDFYNGQTIILESGAGAGQARQITAYVGATRIATVDTNWVTNPSATSVFRIIGYLVSGAGASAASIADAVLDEALSGHTTAGTLGKAVADIQTDTNELQADDVPTLIATLDAVVDTVKVDTAAILVDTGTTLDGKIDTIDTVVDSILVDTATTIPATITALDAVVDTVKAETVLILADTNELQADDTPAALAALDAVVDTVKADTAAILIDTAEIGAAGAGLTALPVSPANVTQWLGTAAATPAVAGVPSVDVVAATMPLTEPTGMFAWSGDLEDALNVLAILLRNELNITSSTISVRNDADDATVFSYAISDDSTTFISAEGA